MAKLTQCPDCGALVSKLALTCPSCGRQLRKPTKQYGCLSGCLLIVILFGLLALIVPESPRQLDTQPGDPPNGTRPGPSLMPEVAAFLNSHHEFGTPTSTQDVPNWAEGKRQRVNFDSGRSLLFYMKDGEVVTVYENHPSEGRKKVWGEYAKDSKKGRTGREAARTSATTLLRMGQALERQERLKPALEYYQRLVKEYPNAPEANTARMRIEELTKP